MKRIPDPEQIAKQMDEHIILEDSPRIGIFWILETEAGPEIIPPYGGGVSIDANEVSAHASFKDTPHDHINAWAKIRRLYPQASDKEYDEIPRGRVIGRNNSFLVYLPPQYENNNIVYSRIRKAFALPSTTSFIPDEHYGSSSDIDWDNPGD